MPDSSRPTSWRAWRITTPGILGAIAIGLGVSVLVGWSLGVETFTRVFPGMVTMKANAALAFVLSGLAIGFVWEDKIPNKTAIGLSVAVALIGGLTLFEYLASVSLGIDELLFREPVQQLGTLVRGRMHPTTAFDFLLIGLASALLAANRFVRFAQSMVLLAALVAGTTLIGYLFGVRHFVGLASLHQMALHTTLGMLVICAGLLSLTSKHGLMTAISADGPSGLIARRLLPVAILTPVVCSALTMRATEMGLFDAHFGAAVRVSVVIAFSVGCIWRSASSLLRLDLERERLEAERLAGDRRFRVLAEAMPQIVWISHPDGSIDYLNSRWFDYTGDDRGKPWDWLRVIHPNDLEDCLQRWQDSSRTGQTFEGEFRFRRHDKSFRWHLARAEPLRGVDGQIIQWVGTSTDIDGHKRTGEQRYRLLVEATSSFVWSTPASGDFESEQGGWSAFTGQSFEELRGRGWLVAIHPDDREDTSRVWNQAVETKTDYEFKYRLRRHDGEYRHMVSRAVPVTIEDRTVLEWFGVQIDVQEQEQAQSALRLAKDLAEAATLAKGEFLANMSHEIRTPMNGVLGMTELALGTELNPCQREYLELAKSSADALLRVIDDILDFSKIEAGKLSLDPIRFALRDVVTDSIRALGFKADLKKIDLACHITPGVSDWFVGDPGRLRQILVNLVGNAIKFTPRGKVVVNVEPDPDEPDPGRLRFSVVDTGIGIAVEKRRSIFAPFEQADSSTTRSFGGTGLGLTISSRLVELMDGRIWVEENPAGGSVFRFTIRLETDASPVSPKLVDSPERHNPAQSGISSIRVLLVEDQEVNQKLTSRMLQKQGHHVTLAGNGRVALEALESYGPFDLILMDVQMPEMDGIQATSAIRAAERSGSSHVPIVALTAHAMAGDRERLLNAGFDDYLAKPINSDSLQAVITRVFENIETSHLGRPPQASVV